MVLQPSKRCATCGSVFVRATRITWAEWERRRFCCVNPAHLFLGTRPDNAADMVAKERQARGSRQGSAKLSESDVIEIRQRAAVGERQRSIAARYGVHQSLISQIINRQCWGWLT